jgi:hypothetical protein
MLTDPSFPCSVLPENFQKKSVACEGGRLCPVIKILMVTLKATTLRLFKQGLATAVPAIQAPCIERVFCEVVGLKVGSFGRAMHFSGAHSRACAPFMAVPFHPSAFPL